MSPKISDLFQFCIYAFGVFLHLKVISVSRKEEDMTWKLDVFNSVITLMHYGVDLAMRIINSMIQDLYLYTGAWFCYIARVLMMYGTFHMIQHSFIIAMMKYVMIVKHEKTLKIGKAEVKEFFFYFNISFSIYCLLVFLIPRPDFFLLYDGILSSNVCLGISNMGPNNVTKQPYPKYNVLPRLCDISESSGAVTASHIMIIIRQGICWIHTLFIGGNQWNVCEAILYFLIFRFMYR